MKIQLFKVRQVTQRSQACIGDERVTQPKAAELLHWFQAAQPGVIYGTESRVEGFQVAKGCKSLARDIGLAQDQLAQIGEGLYLSKTFLFKTDAVEEMVAERQNFQCFN
jgi:hypothetical protein